MTITPSNTIQISDTLTPLYTITMTNTALSTVTMTYTPEFTVTPLPAPIADNGMKFEITKVDLYPNHLAFDENDLQIRIKMTKRPDYIKVKMYTGNYRLVLEEACVSSYMTDAVLTVNRERFKGLSAGLYYLVVTGGFETEKALSKPKILILLK
jgi:hypothetical protein